MTRSHSCLVVETLKRFVGTYLLSSLKISVLIIIIRVMLLQTFDLKHGAFVESSMNLGFIVGAEI